MEAAPTVALITRGIRRGLAVVSTQVLSEFWVAVTRKIQIPLERPEALQELQWLGTMQVVAVDYDTVRAAVSLRDRFRVSYWDALILAAAAIARCDCLYSEDLHPGQRYGELTVRNPFEGALP